MKNRVIHILFLVTLLLGSISVPAEAQTHKADSLSKLIASGKEDSNKVNALNALVRELCNSDLDTAIYFSTEALQISTRLKWNKGIANSSIWIGWCSYLQGDYLNAITYNSTALKIGEELNDKRIISSSLGSLGIVYMQQGNFKMALDNYFRALKMAERDGEKTNLARLYSSIGSVYHNQGDYSRALTYYFDALKIYDELKNKSGIASTLGNIGIVYDELADYEKAIDYYIKAEKLYEELDAKSDIAINIINIGNVYYEKHDYKRALEYFFRALKMNETLGDKNAIAIQLSNIGAVYMEESNSHTTNGKEEGLPSDTSLQKGLVYFLQALKMDEELGNKNSTTAVLGNIGSAYMKLKKFNEAENYLKRSIEMANEVGSLEDLKQGNLSLSTLYSFTGKYQLAFDHYKKYIAARDSIVNDENIKKQVQTEMQYHFDKEQVADSIKNVEQAKQEQLKHDQEIKQQRLFTYGGGIGFLLMLIVAGVSFRAFKQKQKTNHLITEQKNLVEEKQKEILDSIHYAKRIQRSLLPTEKYIERNFRRLKK